MGSDYRLRRTYKLIPRLTLKRPPSFLISGRSRHLDRSDARRTRARCVRACEKVSRRTRRSVCHMRPRAKDAKPDRAQRKRPVSRMTRSTLCKISRANNYSPLPCERGQLVTDNRIRNTPDGTAVQRVVSRYGIARIKRDSIRRVVVSVRARAEILVFVFVIDINSSRHDGSCR